MNIEYIKSHTDCVVLTGGDPLSHHNRLSVYSLLWKLDKNICIYTGYDIDFIHKIHIPKRYKFIKTGKYMNNLKQNPYKDNNSITFASPNQCLYDENLN